MRLNECQPGAGRESEPRERAHSESYVLSANLRAATHSHTHRQHDSAAQKQVRLAKTRRFVLQRSRTVLCAFHRVLAPPPLPRNSRLKSDAARVFVALYLCIPWCLFFVCVVYFLFQMTFVHCAAGCVERCAHWLRAPMTGGGHLACALLARSLAQCLLLSVGVRERNWRA